MVGKGSVGEQTLENNDATPSMMTCEILAHEL